MNCEVCDQNTFGTLSEGLWRAGYCWRSDCWEKGYKREKADRVGLFLALRGLVMAVEEEANAAHSISGNMGARLSDAHEALRAAGRATSGASAAQPPSDAVAPSQAKEE